MLTDSRNRLPHLQQWRLRKHMTLDKLSVTTGVAKTTLVRLEHGSRANSMTVGKLATGLGVTPQELLGGPSENAEEATPTDTNGVRPRKLFNALVKEFAHQLDAAREAHPNATTEQLIHEVLRTIIRP